ncbi:ABC transporter permease [Sediminispirochaeta bajacaliforniensis]|uniref:ABC transporter permease n=1 Tax=Sediminispirochaeta bajacaliforniensis TaxID=148 RepID=UPI000380A8A0|nr:FtsX-like permease family protein [Sediminispirochaeta bajacaliforniensis]
MDLIGIALRNVWRNKRRTILNLIALCLATSLMLLGLGWVEGYHTYVYGAMQNFETGEVQLIPPGYLKEERRMPLDLTLPDYHNLKQRLKSMPEVKEATGRIDFSLRLSNRKESVYLIGRAIDPESEAATTVLADYIDDGQYLSSKKEGILIGRELAKRMGVVPGDTLYIVAQDAYGSENFIDIKVAGIFHYGYPPIDKNIVFIDVHSAMSLLDMQDKVTRVVMRLAPGISPETGAAILRKAKLPGEVHTWKSFAQATVSAVQTDTRSFFTMLVVLYILIVLGLLNSMSMSVHERTREIGTLRAIGMKKRDVVLLLLAESGWIALIAAMIAIVISFPMVWYLGSVGLDISAQMPDNIPVPFGQRFYADFRLLHFIIAVAIASFSAVLGTLRPARKAARLVVADAMRGGGIG